MSQRSRQHFRQQVLARDKYTCRDCHRQLPASELQVHHLARQHGSRKEGKIAIVLCDRCHKVIHAPRRVTKEAEIAMLTWESSLDDGPSDPWDTTHQQVEAILAWESTLPDGILDDDPSVESLSARVDMSVSLDPATQAEILSDILDLHARLTS